MTEDVAFRTIDYIAENYPVNTGIIFFGGEPLLKKQLIKDTISYAESFRKKDCNVYFHYKVTTNGILLDEDFLKFASSTGLQVSISMDGNEKAHNTHRKFNNGEQTFDIVLEKARMLLKFQPYAKVLITISPETLKYYADSVEFLIDIGFRYIIASLDYSGNWSSKDIAELKKQYLKLASLYEKLTLEEKKFYFSPFEMKLASHIRQDNLECYQCHFGKKQISVAHDGNIYPCVQFVKDGTSNKKYSIGNIYKGIEKPKQENLYNLSKSVSKVCTGCDYNQRCNNKCSCLNWQLTGELNDVAPLVCETERILIPVVDSLGEKLFRKGAPMFIQKHYNSVYPLLSMLEDRG